MLLIEIQEPELYDSEELRELRRQLYHYHEYAWRSKMKYDKEAQAKWEALEKEVMAKIHALCQEMRINAH